MENLAVLSVANDEVPFVTACSDAESRTIPVHAEHFAVLSVPYADVAFIA